MKAAEKNILRLAALVGDSKELQTLHARVISAQETERKRLSRDLHDGVGQILSGVKFRLESLTGRILTQPARMRRKILEAEDSLDRAILEIRRVSQNLMPSELEDLGLQPALAALCREFSERLGIPLSTRFSGLPKAFDSDLALALYRITQEALNNVEQHSRAKKAELTLSRKGRSLELTVSDNGIGCDLLRRKAAIGRGVGFGSIRERAGSLGGTLLLSSKPKRGMKVSVLVPLDPR